MDGIPDDVWLGVQLGIDECPTCLSEPLFDLRSKPARPWNPGRRRQRLFIGEAPPVTGGFWRADFHAE